MTLFQDEEKRRLLGLPKPMDEILRDRNRGFEEGILGVSPTMTNFDSSMGYRAGEQSRTPKLDLVEPGIEKVVPDRYEPLFKTPIVPEIKPLVPLPLQEQVKPDTIKPLYKNPLFGEKDENKLW